MNMDANQFDSPSTNAGYNAEVGVKIDRKGASVLIAPILANQGITVPGGNSYNETAPPAIWEAIPQLRRRRRPQRVEEEVELDRAPWVGLTTGFFDASYRDTIPYVDLNVNGSDFVVVDRLCFEPEAETSVSYVTYYNEAEELGVYATYSETQEPTVLTEFRLGGARPIGYTNTVGGSRLGVNLVSAFTSEVLFANGEVWDGDPLSQFARNYKGLGIIGVPVESEIYARGLFSSLPEGSADVSPTLDDYVPNRDIHQLLGGSTGPLGSPDCSYIVVLDGDDTTDQILSGVEVLFEYSSPIETNIQSWLAGDRVAVYRSSTTGTMVITANGTLFSKNPDPEVSDLERNSPFFFPNSIDFATFFPLSFDLQTPIKAEFYDTYSARIERNPFDVEFFDAKDYIAVRDDQDYSDGLELKTIGEHTYAASGVVGDFPLPSIGNTLTVNLSGGSSPKIARFTSRVELGGKLVRSIEATPVDGAVDPGYYIDNFPSEWIKIRANSGGANPTPGCPPIETVSPSDLDSVTRLTPYHWVPSNAQEFGDADPNAPEETHFEYNRDYSAERLFEADWVIVSRTGFRQKFRATNTSLTLLDENSFPPITTAPGVAPTVDLNGETLTLEAVSIGTELTWDSHVGPIEEMQEDFILYAANSFVLGHLDPYFTQLYSGSATLVKDKGTFVEQPFDAEDFPS